MLTNIILMLQIFFVYTIFIIFIPQLTVKFLFPKSGKTKIMLMGFLLGNMVVINLVYILAFLRIYYEATFLFFYFIVLFLICYAIRKDSLIQLYNIIRKWMYQYSKGILKNKVLFKKIRKKAKNKIKSIEFTLGGILEIILLIGILGFIGYMISHRVLTLESFSAPDEEVHLQWIQSLLNNKLFHSGIYPFGMHNVVSATCLIMGKTASSILKYYGVVTNLWGLFIVYIVLKSCSKNKVSLIMAFLSVFVAAILNEGAFVRWQFPVPYEFAIPFCAVMGYFLIKYIKNKKKENLVFFGIGFSLTLFIHFHATILAGVLCLCIGAVFIIRGIKEKLVWKIFLCGILAFLVGAWPIGVGMIQGTEFEQSMAWAVSVISGNDNLAEENKQEEDKEEEDNIYPLFSRETLEELTEHSYRNNTYTIAVLLLLALSFLLYCIRLIKEKFDISVLERLPIYIFSTIVFIMMVSESIGLPILLYPTRLISCLIFTTCFIVAAPMEEMYCLFQKWKISRGAILCITCGITIAGMYYTFTNNMYRTFPMFYYFQTTGANRAVTKIINTYPNQTWTVVSVVNETSMVYREGYHYEWIDLLDNVTQKKDIIIPTKYIFFIVEKMPIIYYGYSFDADSPLLKDRPLINNEDAKKELVYEKKREKYYINQREIIMAKVDAYMKVLELQYPRELGIYYEDDEVVVYCLKQNESYNNISVWDTE